MDLFVIIEGSDFFREPVVLRRTEHKCNGSPVFATENQEHAFWVTKRKRWMLGRIEEVGRSMGLIRSEELDVMNIGSNQAWDEFNRHSDAWMLNHSISVRNVATVNTHTKASSPTRVSEPYAGLEYKNYPTTTSKRAKQTGYFEDIAQAAFKKKCPSGYAVRFDERKPK